MFIFYDDLFIPYLINYNTPTNHDEQVKNVHLPTRILKSDTDLEK